MVAENWVLGQYWCWSFLGRNWLLSICDYVILVTAKCWKISENFSRHVFFQIFWIGFSGEWIMKYWVNTAKVGSWWYGYTPLSNAFVRNVKLWWVMDNTVRITPTMSWSLQATRESKGLKGPINSLNAGVWEWVEFHCVFLCLRLTKIFSTI